MSQIYIPETVLQETYSSERFEIATTIEYLKYSLLWLKTINKSEAEKFERHPRKIN